MNPLRRIMTASWMGACAIAAFPVHSQANLIFDGLSWAPVDQTAGWAYNEIIQEFEPGNQFEGFRHATVNEVWNLVGSFGFSGSSTPEENSMAVSMLQDQLGITLSSSVGMFNAWTFGFTADGTRFDLRLILPNPDDPATFQGYAYETDYPFYDLADPDVGHFLVQQVPEPARMAVLLSLAAMGCVLIRRRRT